MTSYRIIIAQGNNTSSHAGRNYTRVSLRPSSGSCLLYHFDISHLLDFNSMSLPTIYPFFLCGRIAKQLGISLMCDLKFAIFSNFQEKIIEHAEYSRKHIQCIC